MASVNVKLAGLDTDWKKACEQAVRNLNALFKRKGIDVTLSTGGGGPTITVKTDPGILGTAVHGRTSAETTTSGKFLGAEVRLPVKVVINTPKGIRNAGPGILEVIAAHEFVHALGHSRHTSHLMAQTMTKMLGNNSKGDKLQAGGISMPPLDLGKESVEELQELWA